MAKLRIRYLVERPGAAGGLPRYYWQPSSLMRRGQYVQVRVPADWSSVLDPALLKVKAIAAAEQLNGWYDTRRAAEPCKPAGLPPATRTVEALIGLYRSSPHFAKLMPKTRKGYDQCLKKISEWSGSGGPAVPVAAIDYKRIEKLKASMQGTPAYRNSVLRTLHILLEHGLRLGWLPRNPADRSGVEKLEASGLIWPREAVDAFVTAADSQGRHSIGTALLMNEWLGQRQGDILRLTRSAIVDGCIHIKQGKTGARVALPVDAIPHLRQRLDEEIARVDARGYRATPAQLIVDERTGRPYRSDHFRHLFATIRASAARVQPTYRVTCLLPGRDANDPDGFTVKMTDLQFLHLRHTAITRLAEAGCDIITIAAVSGHSARSIEIIMGRYLVKTKKLARLAFDQRLAAEAPRAPRRGLARIISMVGREP